MVLSVRFSVGVAWGSCDIWGGGGGSNVCDAEFRRCICFLLCLSRFRRGFVGCVLMFVVAWVFVFVVLSDVIISFVM